MNRNRPIPPEQTRPGALITRQPRHDNDRREITGIRLLPTYLEVISGVVQDLPAENPALWPSPGASGRFDREFRLGRQDTIGQIRDACHALLQATRGPGIDAYRRQRTSANFDFCDDAKVQHITASKKHGIQFTVAIKQPVPVEDMTDEQRRAWWVRCKRLRPGTVVSVLDRAGMILHFVVSEFTLREPGDAPDDFPMDKNKFNLSNDRERSYVNLELVDSSKLEDALLWYSDTERTRYLLDFPELKLDSFKHTLEALQRQCQTSHHLVDLLNPLDRPVVQRPTYARRPGFVFNLDCLMPSGRTFRFDPSDTPVTEIPSNIDLGPDQIKALLESLSAEVALVYGRPGTGKSYLARKMIKVLVHNRDNADIGPTVCIFHNDSALDRMVDRLLDDGIQGIVRMGGRSDSERLQRLDLPITCDTGLSRQDRRAVKRMTKYLNEIVSNIEGHIQQLSNVKSPWQIDRFLSQVYPEIHKEVFGPRRGDFSDYQPSTADAIREWLTGDASLSEDDVTAFVNPDRTFVLAGRQDQYQQWLKQMRDHIIEELARIYEEFEAIRSELQHFHDDARRQILQNAQVLAVTTIELAKHSELLQPIHAKVLVCDDAGEFLESQVLTAMLPSIEHIVLLGDHQLLPQVHSEKLQRTNREGALNLLDVSLFERLLDMKYDLCPRVTLSTLPLQRRMRPSIAWLNRLIRDTGLGNDNLVREFPDVVGMRRSLFWLDHRHAAGSVQDEDFSLDEFDVEMVISMVNHFIRQGFYGRDDIAVITPSGSQLRELSRRMGMEGSFTTIIDSYDLEGLWEINPQESQERSSHSGSASNGTAPGEAGAAPLGRVRLTTSDSFRGQEAKVVIIALGRCNSQSALHSMRTSRRIDVLMSRARHGCYILGDSESYKEDPAWRLIINTLEAGDNLGDTLDLRCHHDPWNVIRVSSPDEFKLASPQGGCSQPCGGQLDCGHDCRHACHSQMMHALTPCTEPCPRRKLGCEHACSLTCGESCEASCSEVMHNVNLRLPCGHVLGTARCWQVQDPAVVLCEAEVDYEVPGCEHKVMVPCYETDPRNPSFRCPETCGAPLQCGHSCQRKCHECNFRYKETFLEAIHDLCDQSCGRSHSGCAHSCQRTCHGDSECGPCQQPCDIHCSHGRCDKLCYEACEPCTKDCASTCPHSKCTMPCAGPCNWAPCNRRCMLLLGCGHQCPSLCGEVCPDSKYCQTCATDDILFTVVDIPNMKDYRDVNLDEDPCIFPRCGHFQTRSSMDQQLGIEDLYDLADEGAPSTIKGMLKPFSDQEAPCCAQCRASFREISRYGQMIRRPMLDGALKDFMSSSNGKISELADQLAKHVSNLNSSIEYRYTLTSSNHQDISINLDGSMENQICVLRNFVGEGRYVDLANLYRDIQNFLRELSPRAGVFRKVANLTKRTNENTEAAAQSTDAVHLHVPFVQPCGELLAMSLSIRCHIAILADFLKFWQQKFTFSRFRSPTLQLDMTSNFRGCAKLIKRACETKRPLLAAQGHVYLAWFCGFARILNFVAATQGQEFMSTLGGVSDIETTQFPVGDEGWRAMGLMNITKASDFNSNCPLTHRDLADEIEATRRFIHSGQLNDGVGTDWYVSVVLKLSNTGPWYVCGHGHAFVDSRVEAMFLGQLRCMECGVIVADGGQVSEEGAFTDVESVLSSQVEALVDI